MDKDTEELLDALVRRELNLQLAPNDVRELKLAMKKFASASRLTHSIAERPHRSEMYRALADELDELSESPAMDVLVSTGITDVIDENAEIILSQISANDIPAEDNDFLRDCGLTNPRDDITITISRLRLGGWPAADDGRRRVPAAHLITMSKNVVRYTAGELREASQVPAAPAPQSQTSNLQKKPKKYFNGIGKILSGVVTATGNVLIGAGAIPASGGAAAAGVVASAALSIGLVMQGIGDLRGE